VDLFGSLVSCCHFVDCVEICEKIGEHCSEFVGKT
jgi:hypothetical protein